MSVAPISKLYLREFFTNFFIQKKLRQEKHAFSIGLQLLQEQLSNFQQKQISWVQKLSKKNEHLSMPSGIITKFNQNESLDFKFQQIYDKIKNLIQIQQIIFERLSYEMKKSETSIIKQQHQSKSKSFFQDDNELYELLNEYKEKNKILENKNIKLTQKIHGLEASAFEITEQLAKVQENQESLKQQFKNYLNKITELEQDISAKNNQIAMLKKSNDQNLSKLQESGKLVKKMETQNCQLNERIKKKQLQYLEDLKNKEILNISEMKNNEISYLEKIKKLELQIITDNQKVNKFNHLLQIKINKLREQFKKTILSPQSSKQNVDNMSFALMKSLLIKLK